MDVGADVETDVFGAATIAAPAPEGSTGDHARRINIADELLCEEVELEGRECIRLYRHTQDTVHIAFRLSEHSTVSQ